MTQAIVPSLSKPRPWEKRCFVFGYWANNLQSRDLNFQIVFFLYFSQHAQQTKKGQKEGTVGELKQIHPQRVLSADVMQWALGLTNTYEFKDAQDEKLCLCPLFSRIINRDQDIHIFSF